MSLTKVKCNNCNCIDLPAQSDIEENERRCPECDSWDVEDFVPLDITIFTGKQATGKTTRAKKETEGLNTLWVDGSKSISMKPKDYEGYEAVVFDGIFHINFITLWAEMKLKTKAIFTTQKYITDEESEFWDFDYSLIQLKHKR